MERAREAKAKKKENPIALKNEGNDEPVPLTEFTEKRLKDNATEVIKMSSVVKLTGREFENDGKSSLKEKVTSFFKSFGEKVKTKELGIVSVVNSSFSDDRGHGLTKNKIVSFEAVPDVLREGRVIDVYSPEGKNYTRITIAAPIYIGTEKYYMGVMVQRDNQSNRMYMHDVITEKATLSFTTEPTAQNGEGIRDKGHLFITSILQNALKINPIDEKNSVQDISVENISKNAEFFAEENIPDYDSLSEEIKRAVRRTIAEARVNGVAEDDVLTFAKFSAKTGINVAFDKQRLINGVDENGNTVYDDGLFDGDNTIYINKDSSRRYSSVLFHELMHSLVKNASTRSEKRLTKQLMRQAMRHLPADRRTEIEEDYKAYYESIGKKLDNNVFKDELAAHYAEEIFGSVDVLSFLEGEMPGLGNDIIGFFDNSATTHSDDEKLSKAAKKYARKFRELYNKVSQHNGETGTQGAKSGERHALPVGDEIVDAKTVTEEDVRTLLERAWNGQYDNSTYIPLRIGTPKFLIDVVAEHSRGSYNVEDLPMIAEVEHLIQTMEEDDGRDYGNHRPHGLDVDDIVNVIKEMGNPLYIVFQQNKRYAEVVSFYNKRNKKVVVSIDFADSISQQKKNYKHRNYMNGYEAGYYNVVVTQFEPDDLASYLKNNEIVYDKKKMNGKYQVGSGRIVTFTHDTPFINNSIPNSEQKSNTFSKKSSEKIPKERHALDLDYLEAVNRGDMQIAQRMVDEAAKNAGYDVETYHGTDKEFTEFKTHNYNEIGYHVGTKKAAEMINDYKLDGGKVMKLYTKLGKTIKTPDIFGKITTMHDYIYAVRGETNKTIAIDDLEGNTAKMGNNFPNNAQLEKLHKLCVEWVESNYDPSMPESIMEATQAYLKSIGVDSIAYRNDVEDAGSISYVLMNANQVKTADPVTYDDSGKVIPLSKRFDSGKSDIRFALDIDTESQTGYNEDDSAKEKVSYGRKKQEHERATIRNSGRGGGDFSFSDDNGRIRSLSEIVTKREHREKIISSAKKIYKKPKTDTQGNLVSFARHENINLFFVKREKTAKQRAILWVTICLFLKI